MYARWVGASRIKQQTYKEKREKKENGVPVQENCFKQVVIPVTVESNTRKISSWKSGLESLNQVGWKDTVHESKVKSPGAWEGYLMVMIILSWINQWSPDFHSVL